MATPPTFVAESETVWNTTTTKTPSVTVQIGDIIVPVAGNEDTSSTLGPPSGGSLTYTEQQRVTTASNTSVGIWTATASSSTTFNVSIGNGGNPNNFGANILTFRGSGGIGASAKTTGSGAPSLTFSTVQDNSAIVVVSGDWAAVDGTARTWLTVNGITPTVGNGLEVTYNRIAGTYSMYIAYYSDAGIAGSKTVGLSAPGGQTFSIAAVEVKGAVPVAARLAALGSG